MADILPSGTEWDNWEQQTPGSFIHQVMGGRTGANEGLPNGLERINDFIYGTHKARYYLIGADSGVGKTTITDFMFVISAWRAARAERRRIRIFYCSFEIGSTDKTARWASYFIFLRTGKRLPSDYILGRIAGLPVTEEDLALIKEAYEDIRLMMEDIVLIDAMMHPTLIFEGMVSYFEKHGVVARDSVTQQEANKGKKGYVRGWTAEPGFDQFTMLVVDHMALANSEQGLDTKGTIDRLSKYFVVLRNMFHMTVVAIQQFSTEMLQNNRTLQVKSKIENIIPTRLDFGDSKATFRDADVVLGLIQPGKDFGMYYGKWNLDRSEGLGLYLISICLIKNRYGSSNRLCPVFLDPVTGHVEDLSMEDMDPMSKQEYYNKARQIDELCQIFSPRKK